ncbi:MAG: zinc ribbon domain-containing protein [Oscillospiraceae bacterium]|nr:zinc ribbon domain-containing protein [Oscillospiraceae bacterium]
MKNYTDRETAPLKFHYFYLILLVLSAISAFLNAALIIMGLFIVGFSELSVLTLLGLLFYFVYLFVFFKALGGLWFWKKSGLKALYILLALNAADELLNFDSTPEGLLGLLIGLLIPGLVFLYYRKREGLFTEDGTAAPKEDPASAYTFDPVEEPAPMGEPAPETESAPAEEAAQPAPQMRFCRHCGARLAEGARFCAACGRSLEE